MGFTYAQQAINFNYGMKDTSVVVPFRVEMVKAEVSTENKMILQDSDVRYLSVD